MCKIAYTVYFMAYMFSLLKILMKMDHSGRLHEKIAHQFVPMLKAYLKKNIHGGPTRTKNSWVQFQPHNRSVLPFVPSIKKSILFTHVQVNSLWRRHDERRALYIGGKQIWVLVKLGSENEFLLPSNPTRFRNVDC